MATVNEQLDNLVNVDEPLKVTEDGVETKVLEVGGVKLIEITDGKGHTWSVPADDDNIDLREFRNILDIPKREPGFYYQYVDASRLQEFLTQGFVVVDRDEIGISAAYMAQYDNPLVNPESPHHRVGNLYCVKIPEIIAGRMRKAQKMRADLAKAGIEAPHRTGRETERQRGERDVEMNEREESQQVVTLRKLRQGQTPEFKE